MPFTDDQPTPGEGQVDAASSAFDFEQGYQQLRPEYTRVTQELSSTRSSLSEYEQLFAALQDPESQMQALSALGISVDTGTRTSSTDDEFVDPLEQELYSLRDEVHELRSARELEAQQREESQVIAQRDEYIGQAIEYIEANANISFTEREEEVLGNLAIAMTGADNVPDIQAAYNALYGNDGVLETRRQQWINTKTGAPVPPLGSSVPADQMPQTASDRVAYIDERMRAFEQQR